MTLTHVLSLFARLIVGAVFIVAGVTKIGHSAELASTIVAFQFNLPAQFVGFAALALPPFEVLLGAYLLLGWQLRIASAVAVALLAVFAIVLISVVLRGIDTPCGCFGPGETDPVTWLTVARDCGVIIPAIYLAWWSWRELH